MDTLEEWRTVPGYPDYEVSNLGRARSWIAHMGRPLPHVISPGLNSCGYRHFSVRIQGAESTRKTIRLHAMVAELFIGPRPGHPRQVHVCHNDGDKDNNALSNLRYDSAKANIADAIAAGTHPSVTEAAKTHCLRGHEYAPENTLYNNQRERGTSSRYCRTCKNTRSNARYAARSKTAA